MYDVRGPRQALGKENRNTISAITFYTINLV